MCLSLMYFFVFRLRLSGPQLATVQPAIDNRMARSWKTGF